MRTFLSLCALALLASCVAAPRTSAPPSAVNEKALSTFPQSAKIFWIPSQGEIADAGQITRVAITPNQSVRDLHGIFQSSKTSDVQIAVSGPNSALVRYIVVAALKETEGTVPQLQLLFIGHAEDASALRPLIEAKGGRFLFQQWP